MAAFIGMTAIYAGVGAITGAVVYPAFKMHDAKTAAMRGALLGVGFSIGRAVMRKISGGINGVDGGVPILPLRRTFPSGRSI